MTDWARFRHLLLAWTLRDVQARYKQTALGVLWVILQPLALALVLTVVFTQIVPIETPVYYPVFVLTGIIPWMFFANSVVFSSNSLVGNMSLITKVYFPREILPLATIGASLVDLLIALVVLLAVIVATGNPIHGTIYFIWAPILVVAILAAGVGLLASAANVYYRDVRFVVPVVLQLWLYVTPVVYPVENIPRDLMPLFRANPMAGVVVSFRSILIAGVAPSWRLLGEAAVISALILLVGVVAFRRLEAGFADRI